MSKKDKTGAEIPAATHEPTPDREDATPSPAAPAAEATVKDLEAELATAQAESARQRDLYIRVCADLDNYRKRAQREKEDLVKFSNEAILRDILPVIDNLERAVQHAGSEAGEGLLQGIEMTLGQFRKVLEKFGVVPVHSVGTPFDPSRHEAMGQVESAEHPVNTVVQELQRGYLLNERLLRPALVMISKPPAAPPVGE